MSGAGLLFDIDTDSLRAIGAELQASEKQVRFALNRALHRTADTLRAHASRGLRDELQLRTINLLRKRLKTLRLRMRLGSSDGVQLWFGLNDMPASWFKGRPKATSTGAEKRGHHVTGAFVAKSDVKGRLTLFKRKGKRRLPIEEANLPIEDEAVTFIEDEIFTKTETIFWQHFRRDLAARVKFGLGEQ